MHTPTPTTIPARRDTNTPPIKHRIHHIEPNGTIHTLCGLKKHPATTTVATHADKLPCIACIAATILFEVTP